MHHVRYDHLRQPHGRRGLLPARVHGEKRSLSTRAGCLVLLCRWPFRNIIAIRLAFIFEERRRVLFRHAEGWLESFITAVGVACAGSA